MLRLGSVSALVLVGACAVAQLPLKGTVYASGLSTPVMSIQDPLNADTLYVLQKGGQIRQVVNGVLQGPNSLDISGIIATDSERGLLGMAFNPNNANQAFLYYNDTAGAIHVARWDRTSSGARTFNAASRFGIISIAHSGASNHNGGTVAFGADGMMYLGTGDGGGGNDTFQNAQNPNSLLGKMIRVNPFGADALPGDPENNYAIPADNPFVGTNGPITARGEIWDFGNRNPFRWSFDNDGSMWIGDVGQGPNPAAHEEIDWTAAGVGGKNFGWPRWEGTLEHTNQPNLTFNPMSPPVFEYVAGASGSSITGGRRLRNGQLGTFFDGRYFFGDYVQGKIWSLAVTDGVGTVSVSDLRDHSAAIFAGIGNGSIVSFNQGADGALYLTDITNGRIIRVDAVPEPTSLLVLVGAFGLLLKRRRGRKA